MSDIVSFSPVRALDRNGRPVPGARAYFYNSGTSQAVTVYTNAAETVAHPRPLIADATGTFPAVFRSRAALKVEITGPDGVMLPGFPIDPAITVPADGGAAEQISFDPTGDIPETDVQSAIERVQSNLVAPLLEGGVGVSGNAPELANIDATDTPSGFYRFTSSSTGTLPTGWEGLGANGIIFLLRQNAANAIQQIYWRTPAAGAYFWRRMIDSQWQAWNSSRPQAPDPIDTDDLMAYMWSVPNVRSAVQEFAPDPVGEGQTWQQPSRAVGTGYQNTTGRPIQVMITASRVSNGPGFQISTNGSAWTNVSNVGASGLTTFAMVIPDGLHYRLASGVTADHWWELR